MNKDIFIQKGRVCVPLISCYLKITVNYLEIFVMIIVHFLSRKALHITENVYACNSPVTRHSVESIINQQLCCEKDKDQLIS